jgi:putative heme-binding domain-containing protein
MRQGPLVVIFLCAAAVGLAQSDSSLAPDGAAAANALPGNPAAGKTIFRGAGNCLSCHRVGARGAVVGPDLSNVGARLAPAALKQALVAPPQTIPPQDQLYEVTTRSRKTVRGKLLNQDPFSLQMLDGQGELVAFPRSDIRNSHFVDPPAMPSYQGKLTSSQLDDITAYLASLRVPGNQ